MEENNESAKVQVVLRIEDGNGFTFIESGEKLLVSANLNGISLETIPVQPQNPTEFHTELAWEVERKNLRLLKLNYVPIKLECFSILNGQRTKIGYCMLSLKSAPTVSPNPSYIEKKIWQRLLGVSPKNRAFQPEILTSLFIEDMEKKFEIPMSQTKDMNMSLENQEKIIGSITPQLMNDKGYIQIGPEEICTDNYLLHIFLAAPTNLQQIKSCDPNGTNNSFSLFYNVCDVDIYTKEFNLDVNGVCDFTEKTVLRVKSSLKYLKEYFNQTRSIQIFLLSENSKIAQCKAEIDDLITTDDLTEFIALNKKNYYTVCKCGISYFCKKNDDPKDHTDAYLKTGFSVKYLHPECTTPYKHHSSELTGAHYNMDNTHTSIDQITMLQLESIVNNLSSETYQDDLDKLLQKHKVNRELDKTDQQNKDPSNNLADTQSFQNTSSNKYMLETITEETNSPTNIANTNLVVKRGGGDKIEEKKSNEQISMKIVEELEDWKEKQQEMFLAELKKKEEKHLGHLSSEWYKKRTEIENQLKKKIEHSRSLAVALEKANNDAKTAGLKNMDTEKQLIKAKEELERQYSMQYLDLKEAARRLEDDLNHKLGRSNIIKNELAEKIQTLQKENKRLQEIITKQQEEYESIKQSSLNKEQTATLVHQLKTTYEKLLEAQKSKAFFKEQWARALREVHRIKSDQQQNINVQIKRNKAVDIQAILDEQERAQCDSQELRNISKRLQSLSTDSSTHSSNSGDMKECQQFVGQNNNLSTLLNGMDYFRTGFSSRSSTNTDDSDSDNLEARLILKNYEVHQLESEDD